MTSTKMAGYAPEEVIGKTPHILQGPKTDRSMLGRLLEDCAAGKVFHGETINYRKDRSEFHLEWTAGPVRNERGEVTHFAAALRDVTERRRVEEELRVKEAQLRAILNHSAAIISVKDLAGRYFRVNRWYEVMHGMTEAEVMGKTDYDMHAKEIADVMRANDQEVIEADMPLQFEEQVAFADGPHDFISVKFPLRDESGRPYAVCGISTDIKAVLNGARANFMIEYPCHSPDEKRWFLMSVTPLGGERGGAAVAHTDLTPRKRAEEAIIESESRIRQHMDATLAKASVLISCPMSSTASDRPTRRAPKGTAA